MRSGIGTFFEAIFFAASLIASASDWRTRNSKEAVPVSLIALINASGRLGRDPPSNACSNPSISAFLCVSVFAKPSNSAQVKKFFSPPLKANRRMSRGRISLWIMGCDHIRWSSKSLRTCLMSFWQCFSMAHQYINGR